MYIYVYIYVYVYTYIYIYIYVYTYIYIIYIYMHARIFLYIYIYIHILIICISIDMCVYLFLFANSPTCLTVGQPPPDFGHLPRHLAPQRNVLSRWQPEWQQISTGDVFPLSTSETWFIYVIHCACRHISTYHVYVYVYVTYIHTCIIYIYIGMWYICTYRYILVYVICFVAE